MRTARLEITGVSRGTVWLTHSSWISRAPMRGGYYMEEKEEEEQQVEENKKIYIITIIIIIIFITLALGLLI